MENEINGKYVVITSKFNCQSFPLGTYETYTTTTEEGVEETHEEFVPYPHLIFVSQEELDQIGITKQFDMENDTVIDYDNTEDLKKRHLEELREKRVPLLKAFDVYKASVAYGVEFENDEQRDEIVKWYGDLLHLEESAFVVIPERIKYYL